MLKWFVVLVFASWLAGPALAADTVETWAVGEGDVEMYSFYEGVGLPPSRTVVGGEMVMGWGVAERFSVMFATALSATGNLTGGETGLDLAAFGTVLDSDHLDLDLMWGLGVAGEGLSNVVLAPGFELNLDHTPDLGTYGFYVRGGAEFYGTLSNSGRDENHVDYVVTAGGYFSLNDRTQLLLEYDGAVLDETEPGQSSYDHVGIAFGFNRMLTHTVELITQVHLDIPEDGEDTDLGVMAGFVAAIP